MSRTMTGETIMHPATLWRWRAVQGKGSWYFLTIDGVAGEALAAAALMQRLELGTARGFGSLRVTARIGGTRWQTSVFPKSGGEEWLLPVKAAVRKAEGLTDGDQVDLILTPA